MLARPSETVRGGDAEEMDRVLDINVRGFVARSGAQHMKSGVASS